MESTDPHTRLLVAALVLHARRGDQDAVADLVMQWDLGERDAVIHALVGIAAKHLPISDGELEIYLLAGAQYGG
jgi:hypothetical protein